MVHYIKFKEKRKEKYTTSFYMKYICIVSSQTAQMIEILYQSDTNNSNRINKLAELYIKYCIFYMVKLFLCVYIYKYNKKRKLITININEKRYQSFYCTII